MSDGRACQFCERSRESKRWDLIAAFPDTYPVTPGHTLVVPRRHVRSIFDLGEGELGALWEAVGEVRDGLVARTDVQGVNVGVNDGDAAGQTVPHAHVHVIPRRSGDVADPRGGVRWVIPEKAEYWDIAE